MSGARGTVPVSREPANDEVAVCRQATSRQKVGGVFTHITRAGDSPMFL